MTIQSETALTDSTESARSIVASQLSRLVFVGGSPRSGTTLAQRILDCHPDIYGGPEFDFVPRVTDLFREMRGSIRAGRIDAILDENGLIQAFRSLLAAFLWPKLQAEGASYLSEKTPSNVLAFSWLEECVPEAKKILVFRDPRDVVNSMLEVGQRQRRREGKATGFVRDTIAAVDYMNHCLQAGASFAESSAKCLTVYYEDMVADPLAVGNCMYRFIGVHELGQLDLEKEKFKAARNQESWVDWATPGTMSGGIEKDRVGAGGRRLKRSDLDYICAKTFRHRLLSRYSLPSVGWTIPARWCEARCVAARVKQAAPSLWQFLRQRLAG